MDVFAHGLWTNIMYKAIPATRSSKKITYWGIAFGILPDLFSFVPVFIYAIYASIFRGQAFLAGPPDSSNPFFNYAAESYNYTHSAVIWVFVLFIVWAIIKKFPWILLGWGLHIGIDIFSHTEQYFATPFLFPLSGFKISAVSWAHPIFMAINYSILILLYLFVIPKVTKRTSLIPPKS
jgi:hypothetical protein